MYVTRTQTLQKKTARNKFEQIYATIPFQGQQKLVT